MNNNKKFIHSLSTEQMYARRDFHAPLPFTLLCFQHVLSVFCIPIKNEKS